MSDVAIQRELRIIFSEIIKGYSPITNSQFGHFFIKHLNLLDTCDVDYLNQQYYFNAKKDGLPTLEEKLQSLKELELWDEKNEEEVLRLQDYIKTLRVTKTKVFRILEQQQIDSEIKLSEEKIIKSETEKRLLLGTTCESYADKRINEYYIYISLYKTPDLQERLFTEEQLNELELEDLQSLVALYNNQSKLFDEAKLKKIALSSFFLNGFYLCNDDSYKYYGKPVVQLTFYQTALFQQAKYFKSIISEMGDNVPKDMLDNPDKFIDAYYARKNVQEVIDKTPQREGGSMSVVGLSKEDRERLGMGGNVVDLKAIARKKGKEKLTMEELLALETGE